MKSWKRFFFISSVMLFHSNLGLANGRAGNGGDVVICPDETIVLDSYEMKRRQLEFDLGPEHFSLREKVSLSVARLARLDQVMASKLEARAQDLLTDIEMWEQNPKASLAYSSIEDVQLADVNDSFEIALPQGCKIAQIAIQTFVLLPKEKKYIINKNLFAQLDQDQRAALILHEAWYTIMLELGAEDSRFVRYINGIFLSSYGDEISFGEYLDTLSLAGRVTTFSHRPAYEILLDGKVIRFQNEYDRKDKYLVLSPRDSHTFMFGHMTLTLGDIVFNLDGTHLATLFSSDISLASEPLVFKNLVLINGEKGTLRKDEQTQTYMLKIYLKKFIFKNTLYSVKKGMREVKIMFNSELEATSLTWSTK